MAQSQAQGEQNDSLHGTHSGSRNINNGDPLVPPLEQTNSTSGFNPLHGNDLHLDHLHNGSNNGGGINEPSKNDSRAPLYPAGSPGRPAADNRDDSARTGSVAVRDDRGGIPANVSEMPQMPERTASMRNATSAPFVANERHQIPNTKVEPFNQMPYTTNATTESLEDVDFSVVAFARPTGWGKLWRIERNGNYYIYRLRFVDSAETPKEYQRITWRGGKITPQIEAKFKQRKGRGRHADSRTDADRFRGRAFDLAKRIRSSR